MDEFSEAESALLGNSSTFFTSWAKLRSLKISFFSFFWGGTSQIFIFKQFSTHFFTEWMVYFSYIIRWFSFRKFTRFPDFSRIFPDFHKIFRFLHRMGGLLLTNYMIIFFSVFFRFFSRFFRIFIKYLNSFCLLVYSAHEVGL